MFLEMDLEIGNIIDPKEHIYSLFIGNYWLILEQRVNGVKTILQNNTTKEDDHKRVKRAEEKINKQKGQENLEEVEWHKKYPNKDG